ncbi:DeoR/GlpR family DNA-binding transcription regulator [Notoacmeibacter ruber]|uniref:DeoR/GlpR transcriptional regulator n=1 Tax=Notoacmeibacter ruber TaxID=2670375 RepID=A0A3L7JD96_9HYPH|nr:DeoR/GlpR family DNA-binding transcription regulator [Notoacmeibacter ruber]RLQ88758.1 DeoR/GlpR transcriptional regulator [Notoacmeibacter ruber]
MLSRERQSVISQRLKSNGKVVAADLAVEFGVSEDTIRRDLREMAAAGVCERVYGGALLPSPPVPIARRLAETTRSKAALGRAVARLLPENASVFVDAGATNRAAMELFPKDRKLTVTTNAPHIAAALSDHENIDLIVIGGKVDFHVGASLGAQALIEISRLNFDIHLFGVCALDVASGLTVQSFEEMTLRCAVAEQADRIIAPVSNEKLGQRAAFNTVALDERVTIITEYDASEEISAGLSSIGAAIIRAEPDQ